jgi:biotin-dependent carboxylase-like uncharacterized protein
VTAAIRVIAAGRATTIQDHGRARLAHLGVPRAGAVDVAAADLANRLVGNALGAAVLETNGGLVLEARRPLVVATSAGAYRSTVAIGERIIVEPAEDQMWAYLAVRGGVDVEPVLGSRSHDTLSGLGPAPISDGIELPIGADPGTDLPADHAPVRRRSDPIRLWPGPRRDRIVDPLAVLSGRPWTVSTSVSRVGVRLETGPFVAAGGNRLPSEGLTPGAIQITPAGEPIVMLANHPTTGGYPVVAVVDPNDLHLVAQARPGAILRFTRNAAR